MLTFYLNLSQPLFFLLHYYATQLYMLFLPFFALFYSAYYAYKPWPSSHYPR